MPNKLNFTIGQRFGLLVIIEESGRCSRGSVQWLCRCDCGKTTLATSGTLRAGHTKSCGCLKGRVMKGRIFGRLRVIRSAGINVYGCSLWTCKCECGVFVDTLGTTLRSGATKSCGCLQREIVAEIGRRSFKHGRKKLGLEYASWNMMKQRCLNPRNKEYRFYGARGIMVCERWLIFANFYEDMGPREKGYELDREDPRGNYEPGNCRWIPRWTGKQRSAFS